MLSQYVKAGAAIALLLANVQMAAAQVQAQDLAAGSMAHSKTATVKAAAYQVAGNSNDIESGKQMSPMPQSGNLAMLIAGICMIGFASRRQSKTA